MGGSPFLKVLHAVSAIGSEMDFSGFCHRTVSELWTLFPSEQSFCCVVRAIPEPPFENVSLITTGMPESAKRAYVDLYYRMDPARQASTPQTLLLDEDWGQQARTGDEFSTDFIQGMLHIDMSAGIPMVEPSGLGGICFRFTRTHTSRLTDREERLLLALRPHLVNYCAIFRKLESIPGEDYYAAELARDAKILSKREAEVTGLLCRRLRVPEIATRLLISPRTVERHVESIYGKLNVRDRRGLLVKLFRAAS